VHMSQLPPMCVLSMQHPLAALQRAEEIAVKAQNEVGQEVSLSFTGWTARIFQHEFDHLQVRPRACLDRGLLLACPLVWVPGSRRHRQPMK
jgi:hypothetical protein